MEARLVCAALAAALLALGANDLPAASCRSEHFIVTASTPDLARDVANAAEAFRKDLAVEWLGRELPQWRGLCPITVKLAPGAGGATSFRFDGSGPFDWVMNVQGSRERILDSVLPHEITHTIFATHFGRALPRWADEGACTTVEHAVEKSKQDKFLVEFLHTDRGIPFNQMFAMKEYPRDILPLYSQGYSLTRYLIQQGGKRKFVAYIGDGMNTNNWTVATNKHYGFDSLSELQVSWVQWVGKGSPTLKPRDVEGLVSTPAQPEADRQTPAQALALARQNSAYGWQAPPAQNSRTFAQADSFARPPAPSNFAAESAAPPAAADASSVARPVSDGWYARRRDQAQGLAPMDDAQVVPDAVHVPAPPTRQFDAEPLTPAGTGRLGNLPSQRRVLMEWRRDARPSAAVDAQGLAIQTATAQR